MVAAIQSLLPLLLLFCGPTVASTSIWTREYGSYQSQLQKYKLADYVPTALPSSDRSSKSLNATGGSLSGTDVFVDMVFYTVISTDVTSGRMALKVWHNLRWTDERLAWDPADFGNITTTFYAAAGHNRLEDTQIWVPDITLYNSLTAMTESLDPQLATVSSSGQVFWSRPGSLEVLCKYSGLVAFPFDTLGATSRSAAGHTVASSRGSSFTQGRPRQVIHCRVLASWWSVISRRRVRRTQSTLLRPRARGSTHSPTTPTAASPSRS